MRREAADAPDDDDFQTACSQRRHFWERWLDGPWVASPAAAAAADRGVDVSVSGGRFSCLTDLAPGLFDEVCSSS